jgi:hypothetical protein
MEWPSRVRVLGRPGAEMHRSTQASAHVYLGRQACGLGRSLVEPRLSWACVGHIVSSFFPVGTAAHQVDYVTHLLNPRGE